MPQNQLNNFANCMNHMKNLLLLLTAFLILFAGCKEDSEEQPRFETNLQQGWKLTSEKINGTETDLSSLSIQELMYFGEQSLCYLATPVLTDNQWVYKDVRTAWNYDVNTKVLNIAAMLPVADYIDVLTEDRLEIHYYVYSPSGEMDVYEKTFEAAKVEIKDMKIRLAK